MIKRRTELRGELGDKVGREPGRNEVRDGGLGKGHAQGRTWLSCKHEDPPQLRSQAPM